MSTGPFDMDRVLCCPYCGNKKKFRHRGEFEGSGTYTVGTQGRGSGEHDIVCDACGFDGGITTVGRAHDPPHDLPKPKYCPMCGETPKWTMGAPWAMSCSVCGWMGRLIAFDKEHHPLELVKPSGLKLVD